MKTWALMTCCMVVGALLGEPALAEFDYLSSSAGCPGIPGSLGWKLTQVVSPGPGAPLNLGVEGIITHGPGADTDPDGKDPNGNGSGNGGPGFCAPNLPAHSVIGCMGDCNGPGAEVIFAVGSGKGAVPGIAAPAAGPLFLGMNDNLYSDNLGDFGYAAGSGGPLIQRYTITGLSNGGGWGFSLTNPGQAPFGLYDMVSPGIPADLGPGAFVTEFCNRIALVALPNLACSGGAAGVLTIVAPMRFNLWLSPPGSVQPSQNVNTVAGPVPFNPTIEFLDATQTIPALSSWGIAILALLLATIGSWVVYRRRIQAV